ncbi:PQQ-binding-like beta-propeller repeat protein [Planctomicrobium sp. SH661]|uniref:outer membrane protein assembly factor BamB family protein n=1 Tax=Planctomicrobium sp. SH661 TaxID=3448124 RepID=UPI003F5BA773
MLLSSAVRPTRQLPIVLGLLALGLSIAACQKHVASGVIAEETRGEGQRVEKKEDAASGLGDSHLGHDWPKFLGPHENGVSEESNLLESWPEQGPELIWEMTVGTGYSAPSVLGKRLVLHHRLGGEEVVDCLDAQTSEPIWRYTYASRFQDPYGYNNGPRCTPLLTDSRCFTLGADGKLLCLKIESGELVWQRDLKKEFTIPDGFFGVGATPILEGEKLIVAVGGQPDAGLVAFSAKDGEILWKAVGQSTWDGAETGWSNDPTYVWEGDEMIVSYSSPMAVTIHDRRHVLCLMRHGLVSVDPESGDENFHYWFRSRTHESVNAAQPVVVDDTIMLGAAYRVGSVCLKVNADGRGVEQVWKNPRDLSTHWSTTLYSQGHYFGFSGRHENEATLQCVDAATGRVKWETTGWDGQEELQQDAEGQPVSKKTGKRLPWPFYGRGSAILADGKMIVLGERGTLALVKLNIDQWEEVSRCSAPRMKYPSWTAPVLSRGRLYLRCEDAMVCLRVGNEAE